MNQVKNINLSLFLTSESLSFTELAVKKSAFILVDADQTFISKLANAQYAFTTAWKQNETNSYTQTRKEADTVADNTWSGLRMQAEAMTRFPEPTTQAIAVRADAIISKYGTLTTMGYKQEYSNMKSLIEELRTIDEADLTKIGLLTWLDALEAAYDAFQLATLNQYDEDSGKVKGIVQQTRTEAEEAYYALVRRINAGAEYNGPEPYMEFIDNMNTIIDDYKATLAARQTRAENEKKEEEEDPNAPADPDATDPDLPADTATE